jgi:hypothetical protein
VLRTEALAILDRLEELDALEGSGAVPEPADAAEEPEPVGADRI